MGNNGAGLKSNAKKNISTETNTANNKGFGLKSKTNVPPDNTQTMGQRISAKMDNLFEPTPKSTINISSFANQLKTDVPKPTEEQLTSIGQRLQKEAWNNRVNEEIAKETAKREQEMADIAEKKRYEALPIGEKIQEPFKNIGANITSGNLTEKENFAWSEYRTKQDAESRLKALEATKAREEYQSSTENVGKGNAITKDLAQYLPQLGNQLKYGIGGAAAGGGVGAGIGAGIGAAAGGVGALPGAITGGKIGAKAGYIAGSAKYGFDAMSGAAYKNLIDLGVPNNIALELSGDEALISSLIEGGGAVVDLITLGLGKLGSKGGTNAAKQVAKNRLLEAAKAYGINVVSEGIEEGLQEKVSIESEKKATDMAGIKRTATEEQDLARILESAKGGATLGALTGGANAIGNYAMNTVANRPQTSQKPLQPVQNVQPQIIPPTQAEPIVAQPNAQEQAKLPTVLTKTAFETAKQVNMDIKSTNEVMTMSEKLKRPISMFEDEDTTLGGYIKDGTIYLNKNSNKLFENTYIHELTHDIETSDKYAKVADEIFNSNLFYDMLAERGQTFDEYKQSIKEAYSKRVELDDNGIKSEMIAKFAEEKLFKTQESINKLAQTNPTTFAKIKQWVSDMVVKFKGTAQEKELLRIENMYKKAFDTANKNKSANTKYQISIEQAKKLSTKNNLPNTQEFINAVDNTPSAKITEDGLVINLTRSQKSEQSGELSVRKGVFYLPVGDKNTKYYSTGKNGYGGTDTIKGETLIKNPLFVKGATGGKAPEVAFTQLLGKNAITELDEKLSKVFYRKDKVEAIAEIMSEYDIDYNTAYDDAYNIVSNSNVGNTLRYATREYIIGEVARQNGYDSIVGYSKTKDGREFISEVFDLREKTYPSNEYESEINEEYLQSDPQYSISTDNTGRKLTKEQQEHFKDSKVVDKDGKLLEMYHGTPNGIYTQFKTGTYFTENKEYADKYQGMNSSSISVKTNADNPKTYKVYLNMKKPFDTRNPKEKAIFEKEFYRKYGTGTPLQDNGLPDWTDGLDLQEFIEEQGYDYDGLILDEGGTGGYGEKVEKRGISYVAFNPNQIKNVDNLNPTSSDDIRYSLEGDKAKPKQSKVLENIAPIAEQKLDKIEQEPKIAKVLTKAPKVELPRKWENVKDIAIRKLIDTGNTINTVGKIVKDDVLYPLFNNAKQGRQAAETMIGEEQRNLAGERVGNSLISIFEPIKKKGEDYTSSFYEYLLHKHNIDRMAQNKPVFGKTVTAEDSERISAQLLRLHPEFEQLANKVYVYNRNLMQYRVDSGLVSQESADMMNKMYPHYVPTFRDKSGISGSKVVKNDVSIANTVKKAIGGDSDILPLDLSMARQTMQTIQAAKRNLVGNRLLNIAIKDRSAVSPYIMALEKSNEQVDIDSDTDVGLDEKTNTFRIFRNGQTVSMKVNNGIFEGIKSVSSETDNTDFKKVISVLSKPTNVFKQLVTGKNPIFIPRNFFRDIQDVPLYSKNFREFAKNYPTVFKDMATDSELWRLYKSLGGTGSTFFDYEKGIDKQLNKNIGNKISDQTLGRVEQLNMMIEQAPRFAEFKSTIEKAGNRNYDTLMKALLNAADITVNFGRSGSITKIFNQTVVPFLNPSIQGTDKFIRTLRSTKGSKAILKLATKATLFGMLPSVINELLYGDDDDYEKLTDRDKDVNFLIKIGDNDWIRIPKGRVISMVGNLANRGIRLSKGEEIDWNQFFDTLLDQTAPISPTESNILSPISAVVDNKSWYGGDIVPARLQGYKPSEQYDEKTDKFSKWLGGVINYSPKKINYLIDAYTGVIGDFALPLTTPQAEVNPFIKAFTIDGEYSNEISDKFYKAKEQYNKKQNSKPSADTVSRYLNQQDSMANDLYKEIRTIQNSNISDAEKKTKARELRELINLIELTALANVKDYEKVADKYVGKFPNDKDRDTDYASLYANREMFGADYALRTYNKTVYEKAKVYEDIEAYFDRYFMNKFKEETKEKTQPKLPTAKDIARRKE